MSIRIVAILFGLFLLYSGYNKQAVTPDTPTEDEIVLVYGEQIFPEAPTDQGTLGILKKLETIINDPDDAFILANAFQQWAIHVKLDTKLTDLNQVSEVYKVAVKDLLSVNSSVPGKYSGKIDAIIQELYEYKLSFLKQGDSITSLEVTPQVRTALTEWLNGLSWKLGEIFVTNMEIPDVKS
jgi:hypothetical protein